MPETLICEFHYLKEMGIKEVETYDEKEDVNTYYLEYCIYINKNMNQFSIHTTNLFPSSTFQTVTDEDNDSISLLCTLY